ncbi:hypothetical protein ACU8KH_05740 [Lachancea thermotolerans]
MPFPGLEAILPTPFRPTCIHLNRYWPENFYHFEGGLLLKEQDPEDLFFGLASRGDGSSSFDFQKLVDAFKASCYPVSIYGGQKFAI